MSGNHDNLALGRITKMLNELDARGHTVPENVLALPVPEREAKVKEILTKAKGGGDTKVSGISEMPSEAERLRMLEAKLEQAEYDRKLLYAKVDSLVASTRERSPGTTTADALQDPAVVAAIRAIRDGDMTKDGAFRDGYVPPDLRLETPVMFFANKSGIQIRYRFEGGMRIALPDGIKAPITFKKLWRVVDPITLKMSVRYYMMVQSKTLLEFMRKHEGFGTDFFENEVEANRMDDKQEWSKSFEAYQRSLMNTAEHKVVAQAKALGLPTPAALDHAGYARAVANYFADQEFELKTQARLERARASRSDALLEGGAAVMAAT